MLPKQTKGADFTKSYSNVNPSEYVYVCVSSNFCAYGCAYVCVIQNQKLLFPSNIQVSLAHMIQHAQKSALLVLWSHH